jgi:hypothetical protein
MIDFARRRPGLKKFAALDKLVLRHAPRPALKYSAQDLHG